MKINKNSRICTSCLFNKNNEEFYPHDSILRTYCKECTLLKQRTRQKTPKYRKKQRLYMNNKNKTDIQFRLRKNLRQRLYMALKRKTKIGSAVKDLGCSIDDLKIYLEFKFQPGMTWENYGKWEIDHIIDLKKFDLTKIEEFLKACNYNNLQPLWKAANIKKGRIKR